MKMGSFFSKIPYFLLKILKNREKNTAQQKIGFRMGIWTAGLNRDTLRNPTVAWTTLWTTGMAITTTVEEAAITVIIIIDLFSMKIIT